MILRGTHLLDVGHVEVEGAGSVNDGLERRVRNDGLVKSTLLGDILYDGEVELVRAVAGVSLLDLVGLLLRANSRNDTVATVKENVQNMGGNEAGTSSE